MTARVVVMPKTGLYTDDVLLAEWLVDEGARVELDEPIMVITTDKVDSEVPADAAGWLHREAAVDKEYAIGARLGVIYPTEADYLSAVGGST